MCIDVKIFFLVEDRLEWKIIMHNEMSLVNFFLDLNFIYLDFVQRFINNRTFFIAFRAIHFTCIIENRSKLD